MIDCWTSLRWLSSSLSFRMPGVDEGFDIGRAVGMKQRLGHPGPAQAQVVMSTATTGTMVGMSEDKVMTSSPIGSVAFR